MKKKRKRNYLAIRDRLMAIHAKIARVQFDMVCVCDDRDVAKSDSIYERLDDRVTRMMNRIDALNDQVYKIIDKT